LSEIAVTFDEDYLMLLGQVTHVTTEITGIGIVGACFGPIDPADFETPFVPRETGI
jgi:hypothetical protein